MPEKPGQPVGFHDQNSRFIIDEYLKVIGIHEVFHQVAPYLLEPKILKDVEKDLTPVDSTPSQGDRSKVIGIIGAGAAGLYAAMILQDLGLNYEILEAHETLIGGRLLTHHFTELPNDYYDVGAMRFPNTPVMSRTFDLFHRLKFKGNYDPRLFKPEEEKKQNEDGNAAKEHPGPAHLASVHVPTQTLAPGDVATKDADDDVIAYYMQTLDDIQYFNGIGCPLRNLAPGGDNFHVSWTAGGPVPDEYIGYFKEELVKDFKHGRELLMNYDHCSMREFMRTIHPELARPFKQYMKEHYPKDVLEYERPYPEEVINWLETWCFGTTMYNCALSEVVFEELDFNYAQVIDWKCIRGGSNRIAQAMHDTLTTKAEQGKRVTKIAPVKKAGEPKAEALEVTVTGETTPRTYAHVISTIPLGCLRNVNLDQCGLSYALKEALRSLQYGPSVKVGMRFKSRWWEENGHRGGVSTTDRPSRMIVYPSYGIDSKDSGASMLVSYSWAQDALRLGSLIHSNDKMTNEERLKADRELVDIVLEDLAVVHSKPVEELCGLFVEHHAYNWYADENAIGAFAFFGPGQFRQMYTEVTSPAADHLLHFAGEATSTFHAWVVGALNSAVRAVAQILMKEGWVKEFEKLLHDWKLPLEMDLQMTALQLIAGQDAGKFAVHLKEYYETHPSSQ